MAQNSEDCDSNASSSKLADKNLLLLAGKLLGGCPTHMPETPGFGCMALGLIEQSVAILHQLSAYKDSRNKNRQ